MASTFNPKILMEKLAKLNSSQQSIETLSHWCIFHMHKAKQVVETWDRQFNASPREKRLAFLYLANDILQNSRRKGSEFVGEFWKFLPNALRDVINNGDELAKSAALRLINIWEERKVFGSRGQILKEEIVARRIDNKNNNNNTTNTNGKSLSGVKLKHSAGNALEKIVSGYRVIYDQLDEDSVLNKYRNAVSCVEKVDKEIVTGDIHSDQLNGSAVVDELKGQQAILRECVEQLTALESSRTNLVSNLREALHEQELKLDEIHNQLKVAQSMSEQADNIFRQLLPQDKRKPISIKDPPPPPHSTAKSSQSIISRSVEQQTSPVTYTRQVPTTEKEDPKSAAAAMAAKLTASTSSVETLSYVISSLVSEGIIGNSTKESDHSDFPPEKKRLKLETNHSVPYNIPPIPPFSHEQPPPPSSPPPLPPLPPQVAYPGPTQFGNVVPYGYSTTQQQFPYQNVVAAAPFYQTEGGFYGQPSSLPMSPISRQ